MLRLLRRCMHSLENARGPDGVSEASVTGGLHPGRPLSPLPPPPPGLAASKEDPREGAGGGGAFISVVAFTAPSTYVHGRDRNSKDILGRHVLARLFLR
jgi:hypothetical protein